MCLVKRVSKAYYGRADHQTAFASLYHRLHCNASSSSSFLFWSRVLFCVIIDLGYFHPSFVSNWKIASRNKSKTFLADKIDTRLLNFYSPSSIIEKMSQNISNSNLIWSKSHSILFLINLFLVNLPGEWWVEEKQSPIFFSPENSLFFYCIVLFPLFSLRISSSMRDRSEQSQASQFHFPVPISVPVSYRDIVGGWIRKVFLFPFMFVPGPPSKSRRPDQTKS